MCQFNPDMHLQNFLRHKMDNEEELIVKIEQSRQDLINIHLPTFINGVSSENLKIEAQQLLESLKEE